MFSRSSKRDGIKAKLTGAVKSPCCSKVSGPARFRHFLKSGHEHHVLYLRRAVLESSHLWREEKNCSEGSLSCPSSAPFAEPLPPAGTRRQASPSLSLNRILLPALSSEALGHFCRGPWAMYFKKLRPWLELLSSNHSAVK